MRNYIGEKEFRDKFLGAELHRAKVCQKTGGILLTIEYAVSELVSFSTAYLISDNARYCCENRYADTDDFLPDFKGKITEFDIVYLPAGKAEYERVVQEMYIRIATVTDSVTFKFYNEHNGYYSGFDICLNNKKSGASWVLDPTI